MNEVMFSYLKRKIRSEFQNCTWDDSIGRSFENNELPKMEKSLNELQYLEDEIIEFQKKSEQFLSELL